MLSIVDDETIYVRLFACKATWINGSSEQLLIAVMNSNLRSYVGLIEPTRDSNKVVSL